MTLVYISPLPWDSFSQRPHQFVRWYHEKTGAQVIWVEPYPTRLPQWKDFNRLKGSADANTGTPPPRWLTVVRVRSLPLEPLPVLNKINVLIWQSLIAQLKTVAKSAKLQLVIGKPCLLALFLMQKLPFKSTAYDAMDNFSQFYSGLSRYSMSRIEQRVIEGVDTVLVSSHPQLNRIQNAKKVQAVLNACDITYISENFPERVIPEQIVIGYVGTMAEWFDWELVQNLALHNPEYCFRLIGPMFCSPQFQLAPNITVLPACTHAQALTEMSKFSVGLIPFKINELTAYVDPIKYYEYRALGVIVMSTAFGEMIKHVQQEGTILLSHQDNLAEKVTNALSYSSSVLSLQHFRQENSWDTRFNASKLIEN